MKLETVNQLILMQKYISSKDETRPQLQGLYLERHEDGFKATATDGHRLMSKVFAEDMPENRNSMLIKFYNTKKITQLAYSQLKKNLNQVLFTEIERDFPSYRSIIPDTSNLVQSTHGFNPNYVWDMCLAHGLTPNSPIPGLRLMTKCNDSLGPMVVKFASVVVQDHDDDIAIVMPIKMN